MIAGLPNYGLPNCGVLLAALLPALSGCVVVSLNPVHTDESIVFDENLIGTWQNAEDNSSAVIERGEWKSYRVSYKDATIHQELTGYLTQLGGDEFLDLGVRHGQDPGPFLVPVHGIYRITLDRQMLTVAPLDFDWFEARARKSGLLRLEAAIDQKHNVVLTSSTAALRAWLTRNHKAAGAFSPPSIFRKTK